MLTVEYVVVHTHNNVIVHDAVTTMSSTSEVIDYFIRYHDVNDPIFETTMNIRTNGVMIRPTNQCMDLNAVISRVGHGLYVAHLHPGSDKTRAYVRYDYESAISWIWMICEYFIRLAAPSPHSLRLIKPQFQPYSECQM